MVAAVELDDTSPLRERDRRRDELLGLAGIAVMRMGVKDIPSVERLREMFTSDAK